MNKKGFLLATSAGFAFAPAAHAADMPLKAPPQPLPPAPVWTGFYIGGHVGTVWEQTQNVVNGGSNSPYSFLNVGGSSFFLPFSSTPTTSHSGLIGGGQIGYNWQVGSYVFGIEADGSGLTGRGTATTTGLAVSNPYVFIPLLNTTTTTVTNRIRWLSTIRTRSGLAFGDTMAYVTGGVAIGGVQNTASFSSLPPINIGGPFSPYSATVTQSKTRVGWTVGFGVEHMFDQHFTIGAEGLFVDLGSTTFSGRGPLPFPGAFTGKSTPLSLKTSTQAVIGRVKLNYKF